MEGLKVAKLVSGEFVIGRELDNGYLINVFKINASFDHTTGQPTLNIIPYMFPINADLDYFIGQDKIICMNNAGKKLQELYVQQITQLLQQSNEQKPESNSESQDDLSKVESKFEQQASETNNQNKGE